MGSGGDPGCEYPARPGFMGFLDYFPYEFTYLICNIHDVCHDPFLMHTAFFPVTAG